jgi:hypothetical protein
VRRISITDLPTASEDELGEGQTYAVERDSEAVGYFVPVVKRDEAKMAEAMDAFDRMVEYTRTAAGVSRDEVLDWITLRERHGANGTD